MTSNRKLSKTYREGPTERAAVLSDDECLAVVRSLAGVAPSNDDDDDDDDDGESMGWDDSDEDMLAVKRSGKRF